MQAFTSHSANRSWLCVVELAPSTKLVETVPESMGKSASNGQCGTKRSNSWQVALHFLSGVLPVRHAICSHVGVCRCRRDAIVVMAFFAHAVAARAAESVQRWSSVTFCSCIVPVACTILCCGCLPCFALGVVAVVGISGLVGSDVSSDFCVS